MCGYCDRLWYELFPFSGIFAEILFIKMLFKSGCTEAPQRRHVRYLYDTDCAVFIPRFIRIVNENTQNDSQLTCERATLSTCSNTQKN